MTTIYPTLGAVAESDVIAPLLGEAPEGFRLDRAALARQVSTAVDGGYTIDGAYLPDGHGPSADLWGAFYAALEPYADVQEREITATTHEGDWSAWVHWRPMPVTRDVPAEADPALAFAWFITPPVGIAADRAHHGTATLIEYMHTRSEDTWQVFIPEAAPDADADLEPGQYRVSDVTCNGEPASLPTLSIAEANL